jgi:DGQHR domain-containing protein
MIQKGNQQMSFVRELRVPAIEVSQGPGRTLYSFAIDGKLIPSFAAVSRIHRNGSVKGYQRPEVLAHIDEIRSYLESVSPMVPNAIVLALDPRVRFEPSDGPSSHYSRTGTLVIPVDDGAKDSEKPGFVVDGQQRLAAIRDAAILTFPICVTAFLTDSVSEQAEQFILVNSTKPLPKGLIYELLPSTGARLPLLLERRRFPALVLERLNHSEDSPLYKMISTPTTPEGLIKDNSVLRMLENSLTDGILYRLRDPQSGQDDPEAMLVVLSAFWAAAREVFSDAWGLPPKRSRLMHGAGIVSLGFIMDAIADRHRRSGLPSLEQFRRDLKPLKDVCRWTEGYWDFGPGQQRKWNEIQNTSKDIQLLANYLLVQYKALVWRATSAHVQSSG